MAKTGTSVKTVQSEQGGKTTVTVKPGWQTTEFWKTIATDVAMVVTLILHKDFSSAVPAVALAASGVANAGYAISRANAKS